MVMAFEKFTSVPFILALFCCIGADGQSASLRKAKKGCFVQNFYGFSQAESDLATKLKSIDDNVAAFKKTSKEGTKLLTSLLESLNTMNAKLTVLQKKVQHCVPDLSCPVDWTAFMGSCYKAYPDRSTWDRARATCKRHAGDLVKISSDKENEFVRMLARKHASARQQMWIGLRWKRADNKFHWIADDSLPRYSKWAPREPSHPGIENCAHMWTGRSGSRLPYGHWNDMYCVYAHGFICERSPILRVI